MDEKKRLPIWLTAVITLLVITVVGAIWYTSTMVIKRQMEKNTSNAIDITQSGVEEVETKPVVEVNDLVPDDSLFEFVDKEEYESDLKRLDVLINCQYRNEYNWDAFLSRTQTDYILLELGKRIVNNSFEIDVTPSMKSILNQVENTIFDESIYYFKDSLSDDDLCEEPNENLVATDSTVEAVEESEDVADNRLTYPRLYYECMLDSNGNLATSLDESVLINAILLDNPRLSYTDGHWLLRKVDNESEYRILNNFIILKDVYSQMEGLNEFKFSYDTLRVYEDYMIVGVYRGDVYFNLRLKKDGDYYEILNIDNFIETLATMPS